MTMLAHKLRHAITIQSKSVSRDVYGEETITWATFWSCWAAIAPLLGREFIEAQQMQARVTHRVTIRYHAGVLPEMRVLFGSRTFAIESVLTVHEITEEMVLMCREEIT
jgi:SPP1 family predicted phage head-tail adaptor